MTVWRSALLLVCLAVLAPLLLVQLPPLLDFPNHLARVFVLSRLPQDVVLAQFYAPRWMVIPNLALDLVAPPLLHWLPVFVVGRLIVAACLLLTVLGTVAYARALGGRWWALGAGLPAYNSALLHGFLNFDLSLGVALLLAAAWLRCRNRRPYWALLSGMAGAPLLFVCHLMGLLFYAVLIGSAELVRIARSRRRTRALVKGGVLMVAIFAVPFGLYAMSPLEQLGGDAAFLPPLMKLGQLLEVFTNYQVWLDSLTVVAAIGIPAVALALNRGRIPAPAAVAMAVLLIVFLAAPYGWKGTYWLDTRFTVMLGFMLFAGFQPHRWPPPVRIAATAAILLLFAARMAVIGIAWAAHDADLQDLHRALAPVQPGQTVWVAAVTDREAPAYWAANPRWRLLPDGGREDEHLGALAVIERRAWWPFLFDNLSQQPIETLQPYRALADRLPGQPDRAQTLVANLCGFDYVLLTEAEAAPDLPATRFHLLVRTGYADLYAVTSCAAPG